MNPAPGVLLLTLLNLLFLLFDVQFILYLCIFINFLVIKYYMLYFSPLQCLVFSSAQYKSTWWVGGLVGWWVWLQSKLICCILCSTELTTQ